MALETNIAGQDTRRKAVVVLAMHRSGSSALTRVLSLLGCALPKTLMGGDKSNQTGHWESTVVRALNDDILMSGGSTWQDWDAFNERWYQTSRPVEFQARAFDVLDQEFGTSSLTVFKDPRVCRIFPFWKTVFSESDVTIHVVIPVRKAIEVARSLNKRNSLCEVHGLILWLRHMLEAERSSRGLSRAVVSYDDLLDAPAETARTLEERLGLIWPRLSPAVAQEISDFVSPEFRHHKLSAIETTLPVFESWIEETQAIFLKWAKEGEDMADHARLDKIRTDMDYLAPLLRELVATLTRQSVELAAMGKEASHLRKEAEKGATALAALTAEKQGLAKALEAHESALASEQSALKNALSSLSEARSAIGRHKAKAEEAIASRDKVRQELAAAKSELGRSVAERDQAIIRQATHLEATHNAVRRAITTLLAEAERPWLRGKKRLENKINVLLKSGLFDAEWYRNAYPDVKSADIDPAVHFILFGHAEGRLPMRDIIVFKP